MGSAAVLILTIFCLSFSTPSASSNSDDKNSYYNPPICETEKGFYCPDVASGYSCPHRTKRCTTNGSSRQCTSKEYEHCDYIQASEKFSVTRHSTKLQGLLSSSKGFKPEHQFVTYRGLMYEYGNYGARVQDPNDPNYEYKKRSIKRSKKVGESRCTYKQVEVYLKYWTSGDYNLIFKNCQDFVKGLTTYLTNDCKLPDKTKHGHAEDLRKYFFSICEVNCTTPDPTSSDTSPAYSIASTNEIPVIVFTAFVILGLATS